jgi:hypothetical protein
MSACDANTRFNLTLAMLGSVLFMVLIVMLLSALGKPVPDFVSGVILAGFMIMLKDAYASYFKSREELQASRMLQEKV